MESTTYNASFRDPLSLDAFHDIVQDEPMQLDPSMQQRTDSFTRLLLLRSLQVLLLAFFVMQIKQIHFRFSLNAPVL